MGLAAFGSLQAEDEPWLAQCYVRPKDFPLMAGWRSALIYGEVGSGKTALRLALEREWCPPGEKPPILLVRWLMTIPTAPDLAGMELVQEHVSHILDAVARSLLQHLLGRYPKAWGRAPGWVHDTLAWFTQRYLRGDLIHYVASLEGEMTAKGFALLESIVTSSVRDVLRPGAPTPLILAELVRALQTMGVDGVRVLVAELEPWAAVDPGRLASTLEPFLSALALFEHPRFSYTMVLPAELQTADWSPGSVAHRRVDTYSLEWDRAALCAIVERRLALALGEDSFALKQLGPARRLLQWLEGCGAGSPRGWLEAIRPYLTAYLAKSEKRGRGIPLTTKQCRAIQETHAPRLSMDLDTGHVIVGWRDVKRLQPGQRALMEYLYKHRGELCTREKLYRAYAGVFDEHVDDRLYPSDYAGRLDNAIYRLRQMIEPDPSHPVLIVTVKGRGYRLDNAW